MTKEPKLTKPFIQPRITYVEQIALRTIFTHPLFQLIMLGFNKEEGTAFLSFLERLSDEEHKAGWCPDKNCKHKN